MLLTYEKLLPALRVFVRSKSTSWANRNSDVKLFLLKKEIATKITLN